MNDYNCGMVDTGSQASDLKTNTESQRKGFFAKSTFDDILCESQSARDVVTLSKQYAQTNSNILVVGESGSGKEIFVQAIHNASARRDGPFVAINCAALPENLLESELFGYVGGAFTGAMRQGRKGYFELANKGTIFLDEIGEISPKLQARLLRVIQEKEITRVGDERVLRVDTRIISATNKDLRELVDQHLFREDLYYRIDVLRIHVPPLRGRKEDIPTLIKHLISRTSPETQISAAAVRLLVDYPWPGNIRQLNNLCERAIAVSNRVLITAEIVTYLLKMEDQHQHVAICSAEKTIGERIEALPLCPSDIHFIKTALAARNEERAFLTSALANVQNNKTLAAEFLNMSRSTLWRKLKELGIE